MFRSANEIYNIVRKAFISLGIDHACADDLGNVTVLLNLYGIDGIKEAYKATKTINLKKNISYNRLTNNSVEFKISRACFEGISAIDLLLCRKKEFEIIKFKNLDLPQFFLGILAWNCMVHNCSFEESFYSPKLNKIKIDKNLSEMESNFYIPKNFSLIKKQKCKLDNFSNFSHSKVNLNAWMKLEEMAFRTYVPDSNRSRELGAGARIIDED